MQTFLLSLLAVLAPPAAAAEPAGAPFDRHLANFACLCRTAPTPIEREKAEQQLLKLLHGERALVPHVIDLFENNDPFPPPLPHTPAQRDAAREMLKARERALSTICQSGAPALRFVPTIMMMHRQKLLLPFKTMEGPFTRTIGNRVCQLKQPPAALVDLIDHPDTQVRQWAFRVLSKFGPAAKSFTPKMIEILSAADTKDVQNHFGALGVIRAIGPDAKPALPAVMALLRVDRLSYPVIAALGGIGSPAVEPLIALLSDPTTVLRARAATGLGWIGPDARAALPNLKQRLADDDVAVRVAAAHAVWLISQQADAAMVDAIVAALQNADTNKRALMAMLANFGPAANKATARLTEFATAGPLELRTDAAFALWKVTQDADTPVALLTKIMKMELPNEKKDYRGTAIRTLGRIGSAAESAIPVLAEYLAKEKTSYRAARALAKIGPASLPALQKAAASDNSRIRSAAESAIKRIDAN